MSFEFRTECIRSEALLLEYHLVPWDTKIVGAPVAQISALQVIDPPSASKQYEQFEQWCVQHEITLCACRLPAGRLAESMFLEARGFRFIELNYMPVCKDLQQLTFSEDDIAITIARPDDQHVLAEMAGQTFRHGRFHQDPRIDPALGDRRYRVWMENAFTRSSQTVLKCSMNERIVAFFVVETPQPNHRFWSLVGLAPDFVGQGLGRRVWRAMLRYHQTEGVEIVSTSISSQNLPVFNLYVSLGFRFPLPSITLQWRPLDAELLS